MLTIILTVVIIVALIARKIRSHQAKYGNFEGVSLFEFLFGTKLLAQRLSKVHNAKFTKLVTPGFTALVAQHPDAAKFVLSNPEDMPKARLNVFPAASEFLKNGVSSSNGEQWRRYRSVLSPPFHFDAVKQWIPDFYKLSLELIQQWSKNIDKPIDVVKWMPLFTVDVLGVTVLSRNFNAMQGSENNALEAIKTMLGAFSPKTFVLGAIENVTGLNLLKNLNSASKILKNALLDIINSKRVQKTTDGHFDLVDVMLQAHDPKWTDGELLANTFTMFLAGHETTSTALTWLFYHLANNQHVQHKLIAEVKQVLNGQPVQYEHFKELHYVTNVIKENLRLQPPAALIFSRMAEQDLEFEGQIIPKGSRVGLNIYGIHHSPLIWDQPEEFNPDRFDKPAVPFAYLPFSLKSRACLGNQFSLVEQTVFVATFMQHFRTKSVDSFAPPDGSNPILNQVAKLSVFIEKI
jgi:cytochrome P450